ncbi:unnamed protein product [Lampetra planeri]
MGRALADACEGTGGSAAPACCLRLVGYRPECPVFMLVFMLAFTLAFTSVFERNLWLGRLVLPLARAGGRGDCGRDDAWRHQGIEPAQGSALPIRPAGVDSTGYRRLFSGEVMGIWNPTVGTEQLPRDDDYEEATLA